MKTLSLLLLLALALPSAYSQTFFKSDYYRFGLTTPLNYTLITDSGLPYLSTSYNGNSIRVTRNVQQHNGTIEQMNAVSNQDLAAHLVIGNSYITGKGLVVDGYKFLFAHYVNTINGIPMKFTSYVYLFGKTEYILTFSGATDSFNNDANMFDAVRNTFRVY